MKLILLNWVSQAPFVWLIVLWTNLNEFNRLMSSENHVATPTLLVYRRN